MPVRKRRDLRRSHRAEFTVSPELVEAFRAYLDSDPTMGGGWVEHWRLHDLLDEAGALDMPLVPPCCFHPELTAVRWKMLPGAVAIYRRLAEAAGG